MYRCIPESNLLSHVCLLSTPPPRAGVRSKLCPKVHSTLFSFYYLLLKQVYLVNLKILRGTCRVHRTQFSSIQPKYINYFNLSNSPYFPYFISQIQIPNLFRLRWPIFKLRHTWFNSHVYNVIQLLILAQSINSKFKS